MERLVPPPRVVDWGLLAGVTLAAATGLVSLATGSRGSAWVFTLHAIAGVVLVALVAFKLWRVRGRLRAPPDRTVALSALLAAVVLATLLTGVLWVQVGLVRILGGTWTLLNLHVGLGLLVVPILLVHLRHRFRPLRREDVTDRRAALQFGGTLVAAAVAWRLQRPVGRALSLAGVDRRFTGSKEDGSDAGNAFPVTSWVADDPRPIDPDSWTLSVTGRVAEPLALGTDDLPDAEAGAAERALLDCTSGWYSVHDWQGLGVGDLLDDAGPTGDARYVRFLSVTGYRWTLPIGEARDALLATHVDGERLSHGHGFPMRLVAPGRRGFQWVKWVVAVEVRRHPDPGQWIATLVSGLD